MGIGYGGRGGPTENILDPGSDRTASPQPPGGQRERKWDAPPVDDLERLALEF